MQLISEYIVTIYAYPKIESTRSTRLCGGDPIHGLSVIIPSSASKSISGTHLRQIRHCHRSIRVLRVLRHSLYVRSSYYVRWALWPLSPIPLCSCITRKRRLSLLFKLECTQPPNNLHLRTTSESFPHHPRRLAHCNHGPTGASTSFLQQEQSQQQRAKQEFESCQAGY